MTKTVQRYYMGDDEMYPIEPDELLIGERYIREDDFVAALLQVRSLLEAKAKEWSNLGLTHEMAATKGAIYGDGYDDARIDHASELLSLAATLGNQGK